MSISPPYPEAVIQSVGNVTLKLAREHQPALERGGFSGWRIDRMESDLEELNLTPTADANRLTLRGYTGEKDEALYVCYDWGRSFEQRVIGSCGRGSPEHDMFPLDDLVSAERDEEEMLVVMPTLLDLLDQLAPKLDLDGDLEEFKAEGAAALETMQNTELTQELYKVEKGAQARHRQLLRRRIYDAINDIHRTGRRVYKNDPEKRALFRSKWPYNRSKSGESQAEPSETESPERDND